MGELPRRHAGERAVTVHNAVLGRAGAVAVVAVVVVALMALNVDAMVRVAAAEPATVTATATATPGQAELQSDLSGLRSHAELLGRATPADAREADDDDEEYVPPLAPVNGDGDGWIGRKPVGRPDLRLGETPAAVRESQSMFGRRFSLDEIAWGFSVDSAAPLDRGTIGSEIATSRFPWQSAANARWRVRAAVEVLAMSRAVSLFAEGVGTPFVDGGHATFDAGTFGAKFLFARSFNDYDLLSVVLSADVPVDTPGRADWGQVDVVANLRALMFSLLPARYGLRSTVGVSRSIGAERYTSFAVSLSGIWFVGPLPALGETLMSVGLDFQWRIFDATAPTGERYTFRFSLETEAGFVVTLRLHLHGDSPDAMAIGLLFRL